MIRLGHYKYVRFRNAPPLFFDLKSDPDEQCNLLNQTMSAGTCAKLDHLRQIAEDTIDFDAAESDRKERDGSIQQTFSQNVPASTGNLYHMPSGKVINAAAVLTTRCDPPPLCQTHALGDLGIRLDIIIDLLNTKHINMH